jgi:hypothetical protein
MELTRLSEAPYPLALDSQTACARPGAVGGAIRGATEAAARL